MALVRIGTFVLSLAVKAALRRRVREQALEAYFVAAVDADTEARIPDARPGRLDVAQLQDVPVDDREIEIGQRVAHGLVAAVGRRPVDQFDVLLVFTLPQRVAHLFQQLIVLLVEQVLEPGVLGLGQGHDLILPGSGRSIRCGLPREAGEASARTASSREPFWRTPQPPLGILSGHCSAGGLTLRNIRADCRRNLRDARRGAQAVGARVWED